jgi:hypothetical protein
MTAIYLMTLISGTLLGLALLTLLALFFASLYRNNRLLLCTLTAALALHLGVGSIIWLVRGMTPSLPEGPTVHILPAQPPPPVAIQPLKPIIPKKLDLARGKWDGDKRAKVNPRGENPNLKPGDPNPQKPSKPFKILKDPLPPFIPVTDPNDATFFTDNDASINAGEIRTIIGTHGAKPGERGENGGDPNGGKSRVWRRGDPRATGEDGRVYFIRLKHSSGAWNAHAVGINRLLGFLDGYFPCEAESWPLTAAEMAERYMRQDVQPAFVYVYCDDTLAFSPREVAILREYLARGGFLFLDSRPDPVIKELVTRELAKILPGSHLAAVPKSHPINTFLFRLTAPGVGLNIIEKTNYGVTQNHRLAVFYTMGNFAQLYASFPPTADDYVKAQYQMGANVMVYAIRQGNPADLPREAGANARVTNQTIDRLLGIPAPKATPPDAPRTTMKITPIAPSLAVSEEPADITLQDD